MSKPASILDVSEIEKLKTTLNQAHKIAAICHGNPDPDALGSALGVYMALDSVGLDITPVCIDGVPESMKFLPKSEKVVQDFDENEFDTYFLLDCGHPKMLKFDVTKPIILSDKVQKINIDHHPTNTNYGDVNFVLTDRASTTQIIYHMLQALEIKINPDIATALLAGIYGDTGSFMHQNTTPETYEVAADLMKKGGNVSVIAKNLFRNYEYKTLKLWGKVLENLHVTEDGAAVVGVEREDYESLGCTRSDLNGVIDIINSMPEAKYSVILSEDEKGNVKASLRTRRDDVDMKALAEQFGGGGHVKASGFMIPGGRLQKEVKWKIVKE